MLGLSYKQIEFYSVSARFHQTMNIINCHWGHGDLALQSH